MSNLNELLSTMAAQAQSQSDCIKAVLSHLNKKEENNSKRPLEDSASNPNVIVLKKFKTPKVPSPSVNPGSSKPPTQVGIEDYPLEDASGETMSTSGSQSSSSQFQEDNYQEEDEEIHGNLDDYMEDLENMMVSKDPETEDKDSDDTQDEISLSILGKDDEKFWSPHPKVLDWFKEVNNRHLI